MYSVYKLANSLHELKEENDWKILFTLSALRKEVVEIIFVSLQSEEEFARYPKPVYSTNNEKDH